MAKHAHITSADRRTPATPTAPGRRSLFAGAAALALGTVPLATAAVLEPDAILIALSRDYIAALDAYDRDGGYVESDVDPLWQQFKRIEAKVEAIEPMTMAGVAAVAEIALRWAVQPDGNVDFDTGFTQDWPERVTRAVLRIAGGQA